MQPKTARAWEQGYIHILQYVDVSQYSSCSQYCMAAPDLLVHSVGMILNKDKEIQKK